MICFSTYFRKFEVHREALFHDSMFETQRSIFESMVHHGDLPMLNCVLEGLDECEPMSLGWLLSKLDKIFARLHSATRVPPRVRLLLGVRAQRGKSSPAELSPRLRILVFSRAKTPPCLSVLFRYNHLSLEDHWKDCEGGIARYVQLWFKRAEIDSKPARRIDFKHISTPEEGFDLDDADPVKLRGLICGFNSTSPLSKGTTPGGLLILRLIPYPPNWNRSTHAWRTQLMPNQKHHNCWLHVSCSGFLQLLVPLESKSLPQYSTGPNQPVRVRSLAGMLR